jgi:hypothetical protein
MNARVTKNLEAAIAVMRNACADAERRAKSADAYAVQQVLHTFGWGFANASSSIECEMAALEDAALDERSRTTGGEGGIRTHVTTES